MVQRVVAVIATETWYEEQQKLGKVLGPWL